MITQNGNRTANAEPPCAASADTVPSTTPTGYDAMNDLETLRPEVREAINRTDMAVEMFDTLVTVNRDDYDLIRTELLRLADGNARMRGIIETLDMAGQRRADRAEAELAALRKRVDNAPTGTLLVNYSHGQPISANVAADDGEALAAIDQCSVRLVVDDD